jgi:sulfur-oxidizing protein SoxY
MNEDGTSRFRMRRNVLHGAAALSIVPWLPARAADELPIIPALESFLAGRKPRWERIRLELPRLADNGQSVPMKITVDGPFAPGPSVHTLRLFSQKNPVPEMAVFDYPVPVERVELESRVRLAGTQRIAALAQMSDDTLYAASVEVVVTLAACLDGS